MPDDLEAKLEAARAARTERQRVDAEARRQRMMQEELKLIEIEATEGILDRDIKAVFSPKDGAMVVVRTPKEAVFERFQQKTMTKNGSTMVDIYDLVHASLVYPDKQALQKIIQGAPAMLGHLATAACELAGIRADDLTGK